MHLPAQILSHSLAHGPGITPDILRQTLPHDRKLGYSGQVTVAVLIAEADAEPIIQVYTEEKMQALVCGFMAGNGPDPLADDMAPAIASLRLQMKLARKFFLAGLGPNGIVGPIHTWHKFQRRGGFDFIALARWIKAVDALRAEEDLDWVCFEPLNDIEDGTPDPFYRLYEFIAQYPNLFLHWDTGHAHARDLTANDMVGMAAKILYFEFANVGRSPLSEDRGIDLNAYAGAMRHLPGNCRVGNEPFGQGVIRAFDLEDLCDTTTPGPECLALDAQELRRLAVMA